MTERQENAVMECARRGYYWTRHMVAAAAVFAVLLVASMATQRAEVAMTGLVIGWCALFCERKSTHWLCRGAAILRGECEP